MAHFHTCRECGDGFVCEGRDHWNGCETFDGYCPECSVAIDAMDTYAYGETSGVTDDSLATWYADAESGL